MALCAPAELQSRAGANDELDQVSRSLEKTGLELYRRACAGLKQDATAGRVHPLEFAANTRDNWPPAVQEFLAGGEAENFIHTGNHGDRIEYLVRRATASPCILPR